MHMCMCIYMYVYVCMYVYMCIEKNEIRERFAKEHDGNPKYFALSHKGPPRKATHEDVASFGEAVENGTMTEERSFYLATSRLQQLGLVTDIVEQTLVDPAHTILNNISDTLNCVTNSGKMQLTRAHLADEQKQGRFSTLNR